MKRNLVAIGLVALTCLFLFVFNIGVASAEEHDTTTATPELISEEVVEEIPEDVVFDEQVTIEDLDAERSDVLPGGAGHFFKRIGWRFQEILETDPVADAELKIKHANQELADLKQLIDEKGFSEVDPNIISAVMGRFEGRLDNVNNVADALKELKETDPEAVDSLLNNLTDKQFKYQKVLESIERDVIKEKEENENANRRIEDVFVKISETKDKALEHFGETLGTIDEDNPERIAERIIQIADRQDGSEFKHLKNLEVLKRLEEQVPENARDAIHLAQENTLKFFSRDISTLPEEARAERFEKYNRFSYGDETRQLSFLDDLKLLEDVPPEILKKIEEVKEFAISKFEDKMSHFDRTDVFDSYMGHLSGDNFNDMVIAEQFASRASFENNPEIKEKMDEIRDNSVEEFTNRFTDSDSQAQVAKFQELERILEERPGDPKVMKMMQELEMQVRQDPDKAAFLDQMDQLEDKMRFEFEDKFRQEGDRYFDRIGTLDPRDFEVYQEFKGEGFLPDDLAEKFLDHGVDQYRDYMRDVNDPNQFDRFNSKFGDIPQFVIDEIRSRDGDFGEAMQFKRQEMEKLRFEQERELEIKRNEVDYKERELNHQLDRARRQAEDEFWQKINSIPYENFEERKKLFEEKRESDLNRLEDENQARLEMFEKRIGLDPWCDSACQESQKQFIDQEFRHQKDRIEDDYLSSQRQIESDLVRRQMEEQRHEQEREQYQEQDDDYRDFEEHKDYDCGPGKYFDFKYNECRQDSSHVPPMPSICPSGSFMNAAGTCQKEDFQCPDINAAYYAQCPDGQNREIFIDNNGCKAFSECKGEIHPEPVYCPVFDYLPCGEGEYREEYKDENGCILPGKCIPEVATCTAVFTGYEYDPATDRCEARSASGCDNPFKYHSITECQSQNVIVTEEPEPAYSYTFSTGFTVFSKDEAVNYCENYSPDSGIYISEECEKYFGVTYDSNSVGSTASTYVGDPGCEDLLDILPGCHIMAESPDVRFNTVMDKYIKQGTRTIQHCSSESIPGCTGYIPSNTNTNTNTSSGSSSSSSSASRCFYPNATIDGNPAGWTIWCESDYFNCHLGDPSGDSIDISTLSLGAANNCENWDAYTGSTETTPTDTTNTSDDGTSANIWGAWKSLFGL